MGEEQMDKFYNNKYRFSSAKSLILINDEILELRNQQITMFSSELLKYKILVKDLVKDNLSYSIRNELLNIAMYITSNFELYDEFLEQEGIPINKVCIATKKTSKYIEKYKEYIIAYTLILGDMQYKNLQDYIQIVENKDEDLGKDIIEYEEDNNINGIVIEHNKKSAIVITSLGEFKKLKLKEDCFRGKEIKSIEKKSLKDYKIYISIISIFILVFILSIVYKYNNIVSTVVVETTSNIKLETNGFNRVLNVSSSSEKGNLLIQNTNLLDNNIDEAVCKIIEYANENKMIKSSGIIVTITGKALKAHVLDKTSDFIYKNDLKVRFNNAGSEHKLN